jgi:uncharacterized membrane protein
MSQRNIFSDLASNSCSTSHPAIALYLGDCELGGAASYFAGVLAAAGLGYRYVPSAERPPAGFLATESARLVVLSDYAASQLSTSDTELLVRRVEAGLGLLMLGGWESYHGVDGKWDESPVSALLPVHIEPNDDRVNYDQLALVALAEGASEHPIVAGLPWNERPPCIGGFNRFTAKPGAQTLLETWLHELSREGDSLHVRRVAKHPLLVCSELGEASSAGGPRPLAQSGRARIACLATDAAPHWVGPFVDWGTPRLAAQGPGAGAIEVGRDYARFLQQLVRWVGRL